MLPEQQRRISGAGRPTRQPLPVAPMGGLRLRCRRKVARTAEVTAFSRREKTKKTPKRRSARPFNPRRCGRCLRGIYISKPRNTSHLPDAHQSAGRQPNSKARTVRPTTFLPKHLGQDVKNWRGLQLRRRETSGNKALTWRDVGTLEAYTKEAHPWTRGPGPSLPSCQTLPTSPWPSWPAPRPYPSTTPPKSSSRNPARNRWHGHPFPSIPRLGHIVPGRPFGRETPSSPHDVPGHTSYGRTVDSSIVSPPRQHRRHCRSAATAIIARRPSHNSPTAQRHRPYAPQRRQREEKTIFVSSSVGGT